MQTHRSFRRLAVAMLVALVFAGLPGLAHAQATRGTILGTITDQTGAALPGASVTATETRTNVSHNTVTNETGNFTFPNIPDGIYNIKAEIQGFKTVVREGIRLTVNSSIRVDLALAVGETRGNGHGVGRDAAAPDGPDRHGPHAREHPGLRDAAGFQPELPGHDGDGARLEPALQAALRVLQLAGQPVVGSERPVAPGQQRAD